MSDFILPDDIWNQAEQSARDIADAWEMLVNVCLVNEYPLYPAEMKVEIYKNAGLNEIEAIRKVYHEVINS